MSKTRRSYGRRKRKGEVERRQDRKEARKEAWQVTENGAGPRDIDKPKRHHRNRRARPDPDQVAKLFNNTSKRWPPPGRGAR